jgi:hypothetical protein
LSGSVVALQIASEEQGNGQVTFEVDPKTSKKNSCQTAQCNCQTGRYKASDKTASQIERETNSEARSEGGSSSNVCPETHSEVGGRVQRSEGVTQGYSREEGTELAAFEPRRQDRRRSEGNG